jgi:ferritin-like metal-binding protein YciE
MPCILRDAAGRVASISLRRKIIEYGMAPASSEGSNPNEIIDTERTVEMSKVSSFKDLFEMELRDTYNAEEQLVRALPKLAKQASSPELKQALEDHLEETRGQVERLEKVFEACDLPVKGKKCEGIKGIIEEGEETLKEIEGDDAVKDEAIIAGAQKAEHYEIATYGTLASWARQLGHEEAAELLHETLEEEKAADEKLNEISATINPGSSEEEDEEEEPQARRGKGAKRSAVTARSARSFRE